jgi:hypothetical protein
MAIIIVGGSARSVGKTTLVCGLIAALPDFRWTAVKLAGHLHEHPEPVWEETAAGEETDTERYLAAGAQRALLVTALEGVIPISALRAALVQDTNILFESNRIIDYYKPDLCLVMLGETASQRKPSFGKIARQADAFVVPGRSDAGSFILPKDSIVLPLVDFQVMPPSLLAWLRARLTHPSS